MSRRRNLEDKAGRFATELRDLLNGTVCDRTAQVNAIPIADSQCSVGTSIGRRWVKPQPIRLRTPDPHAHCWLTIACHLFMDHREYLTVHSSTYLISTGQWGEKELFRYDYERDKPNYAEAHIQVIGNNSHLDELMTAIGRRGRTLQHLHLPVGGRRFRPALEDLLEFLVRERIVSPHTDWEEVLDSSRERFRRIQLQAAIARNQELAAETLRDCGYDVRLPKNVVPFLGGKRRHRK